MHYNIYCRVMHPVACIIKVAKINRHSQQLYKIFITAAFACNTYSCDFAIHNRSIVEIVTSILIFGILKSPEDGY
jgi:hypothetical protein